MDYNTFPKFIIITFQLNFSVNFLTPPIIFVADFNVKFFVLNTLTPTIIVNQLNIYLKNSILILLNYSSPD
ncbi:hypothetical protein PGB90_006830 [Kerria lacca]